MRKINSNFRTQYMSEEGTKLQNRDFFGFVELDDFACYVLADSLDDDREKNSARVAVESLVREFTERPSMKAGRLKNCVRQAHRELKKQRAGMRLKASLAVVITDYRKIRYCCVGNSRFYLIRNSRYLVKSRDQSLTSNLVDEQKVPLDKAAIHEERNNLYSYLGEYGEPQLHVSKKISLEDGDIMAVSSRGIWERCSDEELLAASEDAAEPQELINHVEDLILDRQQGEIDNYTLAVTYADKIYRNPKKKISVKAVLLVALPVLLVAGGIGLGLYLRNRSITNRTAEMTRRMDSGEQYLAYDNYVKAAEEYEKAKELAGGLKKNREREESDLYLKLSQQILMADESMTGEEYQKAQELYLSALEMSYQAGNVGRKYIESQLDRAQEFMEVFDLIDEGDRLDSNGDYEGAILAYRQAKEKASKIYYGDGKQEALDKQKEVQEKAAAQKNEEKAKEDEAQQAAQKEEEKRREMENQQKDSDQKSAVELENKGNELLAQGDFTGAMTYFKAARVIYEKLELAEMASGLEAKLQAAQFGIEQEKLKESEEQEKQQETTQAEAPGPGIVASE